MKFGMHVFNAKGSWRYIAVLAIKNGPSNRLPSFNIGEENQVIRVITIPFSADL